MIGLNGNLTNVKCRDSCNGRAFICLYHPRDTLTSLVHTSYPFPRNRSGRNRGGTMILIDHFRLNTLPIRVNIICLYLDWYIED
jgi:hypothetical protein